MTFVNRFQCGFVCFHSQVQYIKVTLSNTINFQNSTDDLEVRVTILENDVTVLQDELEEVETDINLHDIRLINVEQSVTENQNDIDGINIALLFEA